ncbi:MAG: glycosyltransferase family 4 protein, partial [Cyanobacteria bacterium J06632_19]
MKFHLWVPNLFGFQGGIQVYSRFLLQAIQNIYPQSEYDIFVKHDVSTSSDFVYLPQTRFHFSGEHSDNIRTPIFASQIITQGCLKRPDLIISCHINFTVAAYRLKQLTGIPYFTIGHGIDAWNIEDPLMKKALHDADLILTGGNYTRERLIKEQNFHPDKVLVLFNTFNANRLKIAPKPEKLLQRYNLKPDEPIILTVARLSESEQYKGYDKILTALPKIRQHIPNVKYILVGKGKDKYRVQQLISQYELEESVILAGYIPDEELTEHYNLCDVFAMPSKA